MTALTTGIVADIENACRNGAIAAATALTKALDRSFALELESAGKYATKAPPAGFDGAGLIVLANCGEAALALVLAESSGLIPSWCAEPGREHQDRLETLGKELAKSLLPPLIQVESVATQRVDCIDEALAHCQVAADAPLISIKLASGDQPGQLHLIWPLLNSAGFNLSGTQGSVGAKAASRGPSKAAAPTSSGLSESSIYLRLPTYSRSLLKIRIPVSVVLATKKESVKSVVELMPGTIVKFEKGCDELLQMVIGGQPVARGEAVKVGDKFGFRVTEMLMPREHFMPVRRPRAG